MNTFSENRNDFVGRLLHEGIGWRHAQSVQGGFQKGFLDVSGRASIFDCVFFSIL